jgi:hypothetical protein
MTVPGPRQAMPNSTELVMRIFSPLSTAILGATLLSASAQAGPMPTNVAAIKSMVDQNTTEVRWRGGGYGYRGVGYRGGGYGYRGGLGYRGVGYRGYGLGYGVAAGAIVGGAIARRSYYGYSGGYGYSSGYPSYGYASVPRYGYGGYGGYGYGYPAYRYAAVPQYGYGGGYGYGTAYCPPYSGYAAASYYGW